MTPGLRVRNAANNSVRITADTRLPRIVTKMTVAAPGSLTDDAFATGTPVIVQLGNEAIDANTVQIQWSLSGTTLSWVDWLGRGTFPNPVILMFLVY